MILCPQCDEGGLILKETADKVTFYSSWRVFFYMGATCQCTNNDKLNRVYARYDEDVLTDVVFCYDETAVTGQILHEMNIEPDFEDEQPL